MDPALRDTTRHSINLSGRIGHVLMTLRYIGLLRHRVRELRPDLVHTNSLKAALYGGLVGRLCGVPVIWHIRDRIADDYLPRSAVRLVSSLSRILPNAVIANSQATLRTLPESLLAAVVHNAVVPDSANRAKPGAPPTLRGPLVFGVVGRLAEWKGQHVFLDAFAAAFLSAARCSVKTPTRLASGARSRRWVSRAPGRARWLREDMNAEYHAPNVLVHCSVVPEPLGQVVIEGMAAGLGVVAAGGGGPLEIIEDGGRAVGSSRRRCFARCRPSATRRRPGPAALPVTAGCGLGFDASRGCDAAGVLDIYRKVLRSGS